VVAHGAPHELPAVNGARCSRSGPAVIVSGRRSGWTSGSTRSHSSRWTRFSIRSRSSNTTRDYGECPPGSVPAGHSRASADDANVEGFLAVTAVAHLVRHAGAVVERLEALVDDHREVDEQILGAAIGGDEAIPAAGVEELDRTVAVGGARRAGHRNNRAAGLALVVAAGRTLGARCSLRTILRIAALGLRRCDAGDLHRCDQR